MEGGKLYLVAVWGLSQGRADNVAIPRLEHNYSDPTQDTDVQNSL